MNCLPPRRPDLVPNFSEIRKVYSTFFAPGLDHLVETGPTRWFTLYGFDLLINDRSLLAQFMLYLTLISNTTHPSLPGGARPSKGGAEDQLTGQTGRGWGEGERDTRPGRGRCVGA